MSTWDKYKDRIQVHGGNKRNASKEREVRFIQHKLQDNLSYQSVTIFSQQYGYNITSEEMKKNAKTQNVAIINSDNLNEKYIYSLPGEDIEHGSLIEWMDNHWLVVEKDANSTVYTRAKLLQCNYLLKWVSDNDTICEQWCVIEDGTKLKHHIVCNSLAYWKRYAKSILLIAGNPLEIYSLQRGFETKASAIA